jgi:hypothetical protein
VLRTTVVNAEVLAPTVTRVVTVRVATDVEVTKLSIKLIVGDAAFVLVRVIVVAGSKLFVLFEA